MTFPAESTEVSFNITIKNDNLLEDNEEFILSIDSTSPPVGTIDEATVTIVDDDGK